MTGYQLQKVRAVFEKVVDLRPDQRGEVVAEACNGDNQLQAFVEDLLANHDGGLEGFLAEPPHRPDADSALLDSSDPPLRIGPYEITRVIAEGGMGVVYEARQQHPRRTVALKVIRPGMVAGRTLRRFQHEAEVLGQLDHPGIAQIYEAGVAEVVTETGTGRRQPYFAMELIRGEPLTAYADRARLAPRERLELVASVCDGVQHAHQKGVIHRDLKPGNILVNESGQVKILDFGVARATDADVQTVTTYTGTGQLVGTIPYMSPEQVLGDSKQLDTRSDVYALGVILYELLSGSVPHDVRNLSIPEAVSKIRDDEPVRLGSVDAALRGEVETIVARALEKDRTRRYQSAAELGEDIRRYLRNEPLLATPPSAMYQLRRFAKRHKPLVGGLIGAFVVLAVSVVVITLLWKQASYEAQRAQAYGSFLQRTLTSADPEVARGRDTAVLQEMLRDSLERAEAELAHLPEVQASVLHTVGVTFLALGQHREAERPLQTALEKRRELYSDRHLDVADTLYYLGRVHREMDFFRSEADFREALRITQELLGKDHPRTACVQAHLASALQVYDEPGKLEQAERLCREALAVLRRATDDAHDVNCLPAGLQILEEILVSRGDTEGAASALTELLQIEEALPGSESTGGTLASLGRLARHKGDLTRAESYLGRALALRSEVLGDEHLALAWIHGQLALTLRDLGFFDDAETHCLAMFNIYLDSLGVDNRHIDEALIDLESVLAARNNATHVRQVIERVTHRLREACREDEPRLRELLLHLAVLPDDYPMNTK